MNESNVVREVVGRALCCGCGVCASVCPEGVLHMDFNSRGELTPTLRGDCVECGMCLRVCPALEVGQPLSSQKIFGGAPARESFHIGGYTGAFVGHAEEFRHRAASGGMTTWTLDALFARGEIDAAVCVAPSQKSDRLFEPTVVSSRSGLLRCCSSKYYPVEFSAALAHILGNEGRFAVVALPCAVTALRKAQRLVPLLRERICYVLALVCGHGVSKYFADFLLAVTGLDETTTRSTDFRYSGRSPTASNFAFRAQHTNGRWSRPLFFSGLFGRLWAGRFFVPRACEFCDDVFAPLADATFMDAWLPEYMADPRGASMVVVRNPRLADLFRHGQHEGTCHLSPVAIEDVKRSQAAPLAYKTGLLSLRVARAERDGRSIPRSFKRIPPPRGMRERLAKCKHEARDRLCKQVFDEKGRARGFWVAVLTFLLRAQCAWRAARRAFNWFRGHITGPQPRR